jgi:hypothetical protein
MKNGKLALISFLSWIAIIGNILFMSWITFNGIKEHFQGTIYEKLSYLALTGLLLLNTILLIRSDRQ